MLNPIISHQIKFISGRKKLKSIRLWMRNTAFAAIKPVISLLFAEILIFLTADLNTAVINHRNEVIPRIPVSAQI